MHCEDLGEHWRAAAPFPQGTWNLSFLLIDKRPKLLGRLVGQPRKYELYNLKKVRLGQKTGCLLELSAELTHWR